jgi:hypothetical protein
MTSSRNVAVWWLAKSCVGRTLFRTFPEDLGRLANFLKSVQYYTTPKETVEPTKIPFCIKKWLCICGRLFPCLFSWFAYCICSDTHEILIIDIWEVGISESLEKEPISYLSVLYFPSCSDVDGIRNLVYIAVEIKIKRRMRDRVKV